MREKEEPFPGQPAIVQPRLSCKLDIESAVEVGERRDIADHPETVFKDVLATDWQLQEIRGTRLREREGGSELFACE